MTFKASFGKGFLGRSTCKRLKRRIYKRSYDGLASGFEAVHVGVGDSRGFRV